MDFLHERLRAELTAHGLTVVDAARKSGVDQQGLRDVLGGRKRLPAELLGLLATSLGIDALYVLTGNRSFVPPAAISPEERALLDDYNGSSHGDQAAIRRLAKSVSRAASGSGVRPGDPAVDAPAPRRRAAGGRK